MVSSPPWLCHCPSALHLVLLRWLMFCVVPLSIVRMGISGRGCQLADTSLLCVSRNFGWILGGLLLIRSTKVWGFGAMMWPSCSALLYLRSREMAITWLCFQPSVSLGLPAFCHAGRHHQGSWESREWLHARFGSSSRPLFIHGSFLMSSKVPFLLGLRMRNFLSSSHFLDM